MLENSSIKASLDYIKAGYPCLYLQTWEEDRAIETFKSLLPDYRIYSWDVVNGVRDCRENKMVNNVQDPLKPLILLASLPEQSLLFYKDCHRFINSIEIIRTIKNLIPVLKATDRHIILVSPVVDIPVELSKDVTLIDFPLPTVAEILEIAKKIVNDNQIDTEVSETTLKSAKGLTISESENAVALSLVKEKNISKRILESEKMNAIKKSGLMEIYEPIDECELGGLNNLKRYIHNRKKGFEDENISTPKGIILFGVPGTGKSLSAKVIASVLNFPLLRLDIASLRSKHVGESEAKLRQALSLIDAVSPVVVWIDEIEKVLGGVASSNHTDGGVTASMFGYFLTWLQESKSPKYIVATCNDIDSLLSISQGALLRRFDDIFFVDVPSLQERKQILDIMNKKYKTKIPLEKAELMDGWTGAEIEKFVRNSIFDGEDVAFKNIKPLFYQNKEIQKGREWAMHNALFANSDEDLTQIDIKTSKRKVSI